MTMMADMQKKIADGDYRDAGGASMTIDAYPLTWPAGWPRTIHPERSRFDRTFAIARDDLLQELRMLGARNIVVSSNVILRRDGLPYANQPEPDDTGVAIYFDVGGEQKCIPVDKWDRVKDNLQAANKTVAALRGLERWGAKHMVDAAFQGFAALPAGETGGDAWWDVLGVDRQASDREVGTAYRDLASKHHPDHDGNSLKFHRIQQAWEAAKAERGQKGQRL